MTQLLKLLYTKLYPPAKLRLQLAFSSVEGWLDGLFHPSRAIIFQHKPNISTVNISKTRTSVKEMIDILFYSLASNPVPAYMQLCKYER